MSRSRRPAALLLATLIAASTALVATPPAVAEDSPVSIKNFAYAPGNRQVDAGGTVTWSNDEAMVPHDVSTRIPGRPDPVLPFESPLLQPGGSFSFTFAEPGVYPYYCSLHPAMLGTVTVVAGAADAPEAPAWPEGSRPG